MFHTGILYINEMLNTEVFYNLNLNRYKNVFWDSWYLKKDYIVSLYIICWLFPVWNMEMIEKFVVFYT